MANYFPTWAAYPDLMSNLLIEINKQPGVHMVGIGEMWHFCMTKCVMVVTRSESKEACGTEHLCGKLEAIIDGGGYMPYDCFGKIFEGRGMGVSPH